MTVRSRWEIDATLERSIARVSAFALNLVCNVINGSSFFFFFVWPCRERVYSDFHDSGIQKRGWCFFLLFFSFLTQS